MTHSLDVRETALEMYAQGKSFRQISKDLKHPDDGKSYCAFKGELLEVL